MSMFLDFMKWMGPYIGWGFLLMVGYGLFYDNLGEYDITYTYISLKAIIRVFKNTISSRRNIVVGIIAGVLMTPYMLFHLLLYVISIIAICIWAAVDAITRSKKKEESEKTE